MKKGQNIVQMGEAVNAELEAFKDPAAGRDDVPHHRPKRGGFGQRDDLSQAELMIAIVAVVVVVMLLLPDPHGAGRRLDHSYHDIHLAGAVLRPRHRVEHRDASPH